MMFSTTIRYNILYSIKAYEFNLKHTINESRIAFQESEETLAMMSARGRRSSVREEGAAGPPPGVPNSPAVEGAPPPPLPLPRPGNPPPANQGGVPLARRPRPRNPPRIGPGVPEKLMNCSELSVGTGDSGVAACTVLASDGARGRSETALPAVAEAPPDSCHEEFLLCTFKLKIYCIT